MISSTTNSSSIYLKKSELPKNVSAFNNDAGYISSDSLKEWLNTHSYIDKSNIEDLIDLKNNSVIEYINNQSSEVSFDNIEGEIREIKEKILSNYIPIERESTFAKIEDINDINVSINQIKNDYLTSISLEGYATESWIERKNYLTEHQSLEDYAKKSDLPSLDDYVKKSDISSLDDFATESWVENKNYLTEHQSLEDYVKKSDISSLEGYATVSWVENKNYLTEHQSLEDYVKKSDISSLEGYATESWVESKNYLTEHQSLSAYAKKSDLPSLEGYATVSWVESKKYLTTHQSLSAYAKKSDIPSLEGYATESWVESKNYLTENNLKGYATESWVENKKYVTSSNFNNSLKNYAKVSAINSINKQLDTFLTKNDASNLYTLKSYADDTYLTQTDAKNTYLTIEDYRGIKDATTISSKYQDKTIYDLENDLNSLLNGFYIVNETDIVVVKDHKLISIFNDGVVTPTWNNIANKPINITRTKDNTTVKSDNSLIFTTDSNEDIHFQDNSGDDIMTVDLQNKDVKINGNSIVTENQLKTINGESILGTGNLTIDTGKIDTIKIDGTPLTITDKSVNIKLFGKLGLLKLYKEYNDEDNTAEISSGNSIIYIDKNNAGIEFDDSSNIKVNESGVEITGESVTVNGNSVATTDMIPTNISQLTNDNNYLTLDQLNEILKLYAKKSDIPSHEWTEEDSEYDSEYDEENRTIYYTTTDGNTITPKEGSVTGSVINIISNTYINGQGRILYDGDIHGIGSNAFEGINTLTKINIPNTVKEIGNYIFKNCTNLKEINLSNNIEIIGINITKGCNVTTVNYNNTVYTSNEDLINDFKNNTVINISEKIISEEDESSESKNLNNIYWGYTPYFNYSTVSELSSQTSIQEERASNYFRKGILPSNTITSAIIDSFYTDPDKYNTESSFRNLWWAISVSDRDNIVNAIENENISITLDELDNMIVHNSDIYESVNYSEDSSEDIYIGSKNSTDEFVMNINGIYYNIYKFSNDKSAVLDSLVKTTMRITFTK